MKKAVWLTAAALLIVAAPAAAGLRIGLFGGYALTPDANLGQGAAYGASFSLDLTPNLALEFGGLRFQVPVTSSPQGLSKGTLGVIPIEIGLKVHFPISASLSLFVGGGGGIYLPHYTMDAAQAKTWDSVGFTIDQTLNAAAGFHFRGGLELALGPSAGLLFEARYSSAKAKGTWQLTDSGGGPTVSGSFADTSLDSIILGVGLNIRLK